MNINDFEKVQKLIEVRERCERALERVEFFRGTALNRPDSGGTDGFEYGYSAHLSQYADGSGCPVDMTGCYVGVELEAATRTVLINQIERVNEHLRELGVVLNDEE